jgi:hypothetical protein
MILAEGILNWLLGKRDNFAIAKTQSTSANKAHLKCYQASKKEN